MTLQAETPRLVLASQSETRASLLKSVGLVFETAAARIDEGAVKQATRLEGASAEATAETLATLKAQRVSRLWPDALVIGADQLLVCNDDWFDKPETIAAAAEQLRALRAKRHTLVTSVVCLRAGRTVWVHTELAHLTMRAFSEAFLQAYLAMEGEAICASVGAYRLEGLGAQLFDAVEGAHSTILGLPLLPLLGFLRQHGVLQN